MRNADENQYSNIDFYGGKSLEKRCIAPLQGSDTTVDGTYKELTNIKTPSRRAEADSLRHFYERAHTLLDITRVGDNLRRRAVHTTESTRTHIRHISH